MIPLLLLGRSLYKSLTEHGDAGILVIRHSSEAEEAKTSKMPRMPLCHAATLFFASLFSSFVGAVGTEMESRAPAGVPWAP